MKKYLMRGGISPIEAMAPEMVIEKNAIGSNSGNLLYAFGVYRTLMTEDVVIDMDYYGVEMNYTDKDIARINEEYDAYICPLADAFRDAFAGKLLKYADFFSKLKIPCYVIGLGVRTPYEPTIMNRQPFDNEAKRFVKAILDHSSMLGLRGEITGTYLKRLGFTEGRDFQVIGCPSMYMYGRELPQRPLKLDANGLVPHDATISFNMSSITPDNLLAFMMNQIDRFPDHYCIEQNEAELRMLYYGVNYVSDKVKPDTLLPLNVFHPLLQEDRYRVFINVPTWLNFLRGSDLCVGSKLHGNVAGVLAGCPTLFFPLDGRMRELVQVHDFPSIPYTDVPADAKLEEMIARVDMQSHVKKHAQNFDRFVDFLDKNGIDHIYAKDRNRKDAPVDALMAKQTYPEVTSILKCSKEETIHRINSCYQMNRREVAKLRKIRNAWKELDFNVIAPYVCEKMKKRIRDFCKKS